MKPPARWERDAAEGTSAFARRAIRRLDVLEWVIFAVAVALATGGGWAVTALFVGRSEPGFRRAWITASILLMIIPGTIALVRNAAEGRRSRSDMDSAEMDTDG